MLQIFINGQSIDLTTQNSVSVVKRSKFFTSQPTRTWTITAGKTPKNSNVIGSLIIQKKYTAKAVVFFGGVELIKGTMQILGWDNTAYNLVIAADGSSALLDDNRTILEFMRELYNSRGGFGVADLSDQWNGTIERGNMNGRWNITDWFGGSIPDFASMIDALRKADSNPSRWPSQDWVQSKEPLVRYGLYGTRPIQIGGWSGEVVSGVGRNKLPHDVIACKGTIDWKGNISEGTKEFLELNNFTQQYPNGYIRLGNFYQSSSCVIAWGLRDAGVSSRAWVCGYVVKKQPNDSYIITPANGCVIDAQPTVMWSAAFSGVIDVNTHARFDKIIELHGLCVCGVGANAHWLGYDVWQWPWLGSSYYTDKQMWEGMQRHFAIEDMRPHHIDYVGFEVQEQEINDRRGRSLYVADGESEWQNNNTSNGWIMPPIRATFDMDRPAVAYEPLCSLGDLTISDLAQICLHIFGLDLDSQNSASSLVSERAVINADELIAEIYASNNEQSQNTSARQGVVGLDGYVFVRGGDAAEPLKVNVKGGGNFTAQWSIPNNPYSSMHVGTSADAATAQTMQNTGVYLLRMDHFPHPMLFEPSTFIADEQATTDVASISRAVRYTAKCRGSVADLLRLHPNGSIRIEGTAVTGVVEQITWSTNGAMEIIFWGD